MSDAPTSQPAVPEAQDPSQDRVIRAMTDDGSFRVLVADTSATVRSILAAQEVASHSVDDAAGVVTAAILIRETMAPTNRVQVILNDSFGNQLVGDAFPEGKTRGLARIQDDVLGMQVGAGSILRVERIIRGTVQQGVVRTEAGEDLVATLKRYFLQSEQVMTMVDLACLGRDGDVAAAAGYVVQLLPELTDPPLAAMHDRLERFGSLARHVANHGADPHGILRGILAGVAWTELAVTPVCFACPCNRERVRGAAAALGREDLEGLLARQESLAVTCDYCRQAYDLGVDDYRIILATDDPVDDADQTSAT